MTIKNIIFDLGGVILNLDFNQMYSAFLRLGVKNFENIYSQSMQNQLIDNFEIGKISAKEFRKQLTHAFQISVSDEEFDKAWNAMLQDLPNERVQLIQKLKNNYKTFLLSNTNEIHLKSLRDTHGVAIFQNCFHKEYYSHEIGKHKPDPEVFLTILNENNLKASETLFLDDTIRHIEAAKKLGLQTQLIHAGFTVFDLSKLLQISDEK